MFVNVSHLPSVTKFPLLLRTHHLKQQCPCHSLASPIPSPYSLYWLIHSCQDMKTVRQLHSSLIVSNGSIPTSIASKLMSLYAEFKDLQSVIWVFNKMKQDPDTKMWNLIIRCHVDSSLFYSALQLYKRMRRLGIKHDTFTFPIVNRAISSLLADIRTGEMVHCVSIQMGLDADVYFGNTMMEVYVKCGRVGDARKVFDEMPHRDLVSWTSMISGYISEGEFNRACNLFNRMRMDLEPNPVTLIIMLQAVCSPEMLDKGKHLHCHAVKSGLVLYASLQNSILTMYTKTGDVQTVEDFSSEIGNTDVSLNILVSFYAAMGDLLKVSASLKRMHSEAPCSWSIETITSVISAFAKSVYSAEGESMHSLVIKTGLADDVLLTSLLDFYAKSGKMKESAQVFKEINYRSNITWGAVMSGLIQNGYFVEAVSLFEEMRVACIDPAPEILRNLVDAYANFGVLKLGKGVHGYLIRNHYYYQANNESAQLETSTMNMYIKCGSIASALVCFEGIRVKDLVTWTTMMEGLGSHGFGSVALNLFHVMVDQRVQPNSVTFLSLLSACSHSGLVNEACRIYDTMKSVYGIEPGLDHNTCLVDLLGRHGHLQQALTMILKMSVFPDSRIWGALLSASRVYGNRKLGEFAAEKLLEMEPDNVGYFTLFSNLKASAGKWDEVVEVRKLMYEKDLRKKPGWSCIEVNETVHGFVSGDPSHTNSYEIKELLCSLIVVLKE